MYQHARWPQKLPSKTRHRCGESTSGKYCIDNGAPDSPRNAIALIMSERTQKDGKKSKIERAANENRLMQKLSRQPWREPAMHRGKRRFHRGGEALQILMGKFTVPELVTGGDRSLATTSRCEPAGDRLRRSTNAQLFPSEALDDYRRCNRSHFIPTLPCIQGYLQSSDRAILMLLDFCFYSCCDTERSIHRGVSKMIVGLLTLLWLINGVIFGFVGWFGS